MKQALTVGCGSGNGGLVIDTLLDRGYAVTNLGSSAHDRASNIQIAWKDLDIPKLYSLVKISGPVHFVFFNQNSSSLEDSYFELNKIGTIDMWRLVKDWQHAHWISCQMPVLLLHLLQKNIGADTKIGWMLSPTMRWDLVYAQRYPDYSSNKFFNYLAMQCLAKHYQTFGVVPDFSNNHGKNQMIKILDHVCDNQVNGNLFEFETK